MLKHLVPFVIAAFAFSTTAPKASEYLGGLYLCTVIETGGAENMLEIGDRFFIGVSTLVDRIMFLYKEGSGNVKDCEVSASIWICESKAIGRSAVFDTESQILTDPFGFRDGYDRSQCELFPL